MPETDFLRLKRFDFEPLDRISKHGERLYKVHYYKYPIYVGKY